MTNPDARNAFLERAASYSKVITHSGTVPRPTGGSTMPGSAAASGPPLNDSQLEQAQRLLAQHLGPIAKVVVKKAAASTRDRQSFYTALLDAVTDAAAREKLRAELARLA